MAEEVEAEVTDYAPLASAVDFERAIKDAQPDYGVDTDALKKNLSQVGRERAEATVDAAERQQKALVEGHEFVRDKYEGVGPLDAQPWDSEKERAERIQSPLEAFGSAAGIFAMIASAFTKTPMDTALNAGAAAINSVRANDYRNYDLAYNEWQKNTDLAIKRHETERQAFRDALDLYKADPIAGGAELKAVAARFGAIAEMAAIDAGYVPAVAEIQDAKAKSAQAILQQMPNIAKMDEVMRVNILSGQAIKEFQEANKREPTAVEAAQIIGGIRRRLQSAGGVFTGARQEAYAIQEKADQIMREAQERGEEITAPDAYARAAREIKTASAAMTGNQQDKLRGHVDQLDISNKKIEDVIGVLERKLGAAGLPGRVTRLKERVWNLFGDNDTDRVQMMRDLQYLRMNASRLLVDASGKPLAQEAARVNDIVAGIEAGDTAANTLRALEEVRKIYTEMRNTTLSRIQGTWKPGGGHSEPQGSVPSIPRRSSAPWANDPIVK